MSVSVGMAGNLAPLFARVIRMMRMSRLPTPRAALAVLTGVNLVNYLDRLIPAAILPLVIAELHISDGKAGSLYTLFMLSYVFVSPLAGWLGDRHPRFRIAGAGVLVWSAATFGSGLAPTFAALAAARILIGFGEASYVVVTPSLLSDFYPPAKRGAALSIFYSAIPIGSALGYVLGGQIAAHFGWRWAFFVAGVPGAVLALALMTLRDPPRGTFDPVAANTPPLGGLWRELVARRSYVFNTAAQTIYTFAMGGLAVWMPTYFQRVRGLSLATATTAFGATLLASGLVGTLIGGRLGDFMSHRRPDGHFVLSGVALIVSLPFTLLAILSPSPAIFWPAMFVTLTLLFLNQGPLNAAMANVLPAGLRGRGFAFNTVAIHLFGDVFSALLIGVASDHVGLRIPVLATGVLLVLSGLVLMAGRAALTRDLKAAA
jgi:MFS transporter, Spinster family, sphingosine-1-phosphate transporter